MTGRAYVMMAWNGLPQDLCKCSTGLRAFIKKSAGLGKMTLEANSKRTDKKLSLSLFVRVLWDL